jgi:hypothetical protein
MATVTPAINNAIAEVPRIIWSGMVTGDTINPWKITAQYGLAAAVQISGTFGGASVKLQASNDGTNYFDMEDVTGTAVSTGSGGLYEISTAAIYLLPVVTGGSANSINVIIALRGSSSND